MLGLIYLNESWLAPWMASHTPQAQVALPTKILSTIYYNGSNSSPAKCDGSCYEDVWALGKQSMFNKLLEPGVESWPNQ